MLLALSLCVVCEQNNAKTTAWISSAETDGRTSVSQFDSVYYILHIVFSLILTHLLSLLMHSTILGLFIDTLYIIYKVCQLYIDIARKKEFPQLTFLKLHLLL